MFEVVEVVVWSNSEGHFPPHCSILVMWGSFEGRVEALRGAGETLWASDGTLREAMGSPWEHSEVT